MTKTQIYLYLKHFPPQGDRLSEGATKFVHGLASGLVRCGAELTVLCEGSNSSSWQAPAGYTIECFANHQSEPSFQIASGLKEYINNQIENGLVILNGMFHRSVYSLSRLLRQRKIPYIISPLDPYHPSIFKKNAHLKWPYWYFLERRMLKQALAIQLLDIRHAEWLLRLGVQNPVLATPCGFFPSDIHPESTLLWREKEEPKIFFLGRLDAYNKGLDILLDALAQIREVSNARLFIQGPDWGDRKKLEKQAVQLGLSERVSFLDPDYNASPSSLIANYDIFCIPSRFEGFSQSALEAMLSGRVLLISEVAGIAPHVRASQCGIVVNPEASAIKAGFLELLHRRSEWREMGLNGRRYVLKNLSWDEIAARAIEQYKHLLASVM
jgi:glycosyltransferase involved in cell wall biosynthesis